MSEKLLKQIADELSSIYSNIPSEANLYDVESKLDKLISLMENQNEISERISDQLENIDNNLPSGSNISTSLIETRLDKIWEKLDDMNSNLGYIESNTGNL